MKQPKNTQRLSAAFVAVFILSASIAVAEDQWDNDQKIRPLNDPVYDLIETLSLEVGRPLLSSTPPVSDARIRSILKSIDPDSLSTAGKEAWALISKELAEQPLIRAPFSGFSAGLTTTPEIAWRSDENVPWMNRYEVRPPALVVPLEIWFGPSVYGYSELDLAQDPNAVAAAPGTGIGFNLADMLAQPLGIDTTFPFRAFLNAGGEWWSFTIGRDKLTLGSAGELNLTVSSSPEFYDFGRLSFFGPNLAYTILMIQLEPERNLYLHRLDFRPWDWISIGLTEATLVGAAPRELRYFNPFMIFHGYIAWNEYPAAGFANGVGSEAGIELNVTPTKGLDLYGQFQMNAIEDPLKLFFWPSQVSQMPDSFGALTGFKLRLPFGRNYLIANGTVAYTTPFDYILTANDISYVYMRPAHSNYPGSLYSSSWIGMLDGPDTILGQLSVGYERPGLSTVSLEMIWRAQGENADTSLFNWGSSSTINNWNSSSPTPGISTETTPSGTAGVFFDHWRERGLSPLRLDGSRGRALLDRPMERRSCARCPGQFSGIGSLCEFQHLSPAGLEGRPRAARFFSCLPPRSHDILPENCS